MNIDSIQNGIVLDHITAGKALQIYNDLHLDKLDCSVAIIKNVKSEKMGRKDILKIDQDIDINLDVLGTSSAMSTPASPSTSSRTASSLKNVRSNCLRDWLE